MNRIETVLVGNKIIRQKYLNMNKIDKKFYNRKSNKWAIKVIISLSLTWVMLNANEVKEGEQVLFSQQSVSPCFINYNVLVQEGLVSNPNILVSKNAIKGSEYKIEGAKWGYYPSPSIEVSSTTSSGLRTVARLDQPLWTGGKLDSIYDNALAQKDEAIHSHAQEQYTLIRKYITALQDYLQAQNKISLLHKNTNQFKTLGKMLDRMITAGIASKADRDLLNSRLSGVYSQILTTKSKLKIAKVQFELFTGKPINCKINYEYKKEFDRNDDIEKLMEKSSFFHPSLKILDANIKTTISELGNSKSKLWPTLILRGEHRNGTLYDEDTEPSTQNSIYLTFQYSPGAGLSSISDIGEKRSNILRAKSQKLAKEEELADELINEYTTYITVKSNIEILLENIIRAKHIYQSDKRLYMSQKKDWIDLVNSLSKWNQQEILHSDLDIEKKILEYKMNLRTGKINLGTGVVFNVL